MAARPAAVARPRTPAAVLGTLVLVLAVVVGAVALTSRQAAPPAVAEFAPQSVEQIKKALDAQAAAAGGSSPSPSPTPTAPPSAGTSASPGSTPGPTPGPSIVVPRVRQCVGTPPRQSAAKYPNATPPTTAPMIEMPPVHSCGMSSG